jgi:hypothetical protein
MNSSLGELILSRLPLMWRRHTLAPQTRSMIYFADVIKPCIKQGPRGATESASWSLSKRFCFLMPSVPVSKNRASPCMVTDGGKLIRVRC